MYIHIDHLEGRGPAHRWAEEALYSAALSPTLLMCVGINII